MRETENGKENWSEAIERAKQHFSDGWKELGQAAELAKGKGAKSLAEAQSKGREVWEEAKEAGSDVLDEAREKGEEALKDAERLVKKYPAKAIGLSVLVGVVLGVLLGRDRD